MNGQRFLKDEGTFGDPGCKRMMDPQTRICFVLFEKEYVQISNKKEAQAALAVYYLSSHLGMYPHKPTQSFLIGANSQ